MIIKISGNEITSLTDAVVLENGNMRGHIDNITVKMISEDGTDFLQGLAYIELYKMKASTYAKIRTLWIAPECRNIGFGKALLENLEKIVNDEAKNINVDPIAYTFINIEENNEAIDWFKKMGFEVKGKKSGNICIMRK